MNERIRFLLDQIAALDEDLRKAMQEHEATLLYRVRGKRVEFETSVLNAHNQVWDSPNVFVTDSSCFVTNGTCGPTLTTMALTVRACAHIAAEYGHAECVTLLLDRGAREAMITFERGVATLHLVTRKRRR